MKTEVRPNRLFAPKLVGLVPSMDREKIKRKVDKSTSNNLDFSS